jgi:hypothetical protein
MLKMQFLGKSLEDMGTGEKFLNRTAMACAVRSRIDKWDLIKLESFCKAKDTINKTKRPPTYWERIFTYPKSDRGLISNICTVFYFEQTKLLCHPTGTFTASRLHIVFIRLYHLMISRTSSFA